jgi:hypothetical protein
MEGGSEELRDVCVQVTQALKNTGFLPDVNGEGSSSALTPEPHNNSVPDAPLEVSRHPPPSLLFYSPRRSSVKGTVPRDFRLLFFFMNQFPPSP